MEKILTVNDVAAVLQVKAITVREMFRENRLRGFKVGKAWRTTQQMLQEDIEALVRGETPPPLPKVSADGNGSATPARRKPKAPKTEGAEAKPKKSRKAAAPDNGNGDGHAEVAEVIDTQQLLF